MLHTLTLRTRTALLFIGLVALLLGIFGVYVYVESSKLRAAEFNERLRERADVAGRIANGAGQLAPAQQSQLEAQLRNTLPNEALAVFTKNDSLLLEQGPTLRPSRARLTMAHQDGLHTWTEGRRQHLLEVVGKGENALVVAVAAEDRLGYEQLDGLTNAIIWGGLLGVALAGGIAWLFAGWSMQPVHDLTEQALRIQSPSERLVPPESEDELGDLSAAFNRLLARLDEAFALQRAFIANASHELRTPLAVLMAELHTLRQDAHAGQYAQLDAMQATLTRLSELIQQLLWMAQSAQAPENVPMAAVRLDELTFDAVQQARQRYPGRDIQLNLSQLAEADHEPLVQGNGVLLQAAVFNLIGNACKYSTPGTPVQVAIEAGDAMTVVVTDQGPGVPALELPKLKQPFYRTVGSSASQEGSGIGLALTDRIAMLHGGSLLLTIATSGGLQAQLSLPSHQAER